MKAGDCLGFPAGQGVGHCIVNRSDKKSQWCISKSGIVRAEEDLKVVEADGKWQFLRKDGGVPIQNKQLDIATS